MCDLRLEFAMEIVLPLIIIESAGTDVNQFITKVMRNRLDAFFIYHSLLTDSLICKFPELSGHREIANFVLETLFCWNDYGTNAACPCVCHPSLPNSNLHAFGLECPCMSDPAYEMAPTPDPPRPTLRAAMEAEHNVVRKPALVA